MELHNDKMFETRVKDVSLQIRDGKAYTCKGDEKCQLDVIGHIDSYKYLYLFTLSHVDEKYRIYILSLNLDEAKLESMLLDEFDKEPSISMHNSGEVVNMVVNGREYAMWHDINYNHLRILTPEFHWPRIGFVVGIIAVFLYFLFL